MLTRSKDIEEELVENGVPDWCVEGMSETQLEVAEQVMDVLPVVEHMHPVELSLTPDMPSVVHGEVECLHITIDSREMGAIVSERAIERSIHNLVDTRYTASEYAILAADKHGGWRIEVSSDDGC